MLLNFGFWLFWRIHLSERKMFPCVLRSGLFLSLTTFRIFALLPPGISCKVLKMLGWNPYCSESVFVCCARVFKEKRKIPRGHMLVQPAIRTTQSVLQILTVCCPRAREKQVPWTRRKLFIKCGRWEPVVLGMNELFWAEFKSIVRKTYETILNLTHFQYSTFTRWITRLQIFMPDPRVVVFVLVVSSYRTRSDVKAPVICLQLKHIIWGTLSVV